MVLEGFENGDILVCPMIHPSWLPHVIAAAAVVSEVGGALSHMAIIARENRVPMLVGVGAPEYLGTGDWVSVDTDGFVEPDQAKQAVVVAE